MRQFKMVNKIHLHFSAQIQRINIRTAHTEWNSAQMHTS